MGYDEVWFIGDTHFLAQARAVLEDLNDVESFSRATSKVRLPYLLENFEVLFGSFHHSWSFTTQILGGLNGLLSTKWRLPNYIYMLFSNDQISDSEVLGEELYDVLKELFTSVNRAITARKVLLPKKARRYKPPSVCVVRTVPKSERKQSEKTFKNKRRTLNRAIQKTAADFQWRTINIDNILPKQEKHFDDQGNDLSKEGFRVFWEFVSEDLRCVEQSNNYNNGPTVHTQRSFGPIRNNYHKTYEHSNQF